MRRPTVLAGVFLVILAGASPAALAEAVVPSAAPARAPSCVDSRETAATAMSTAKACGRPVEDLSRRTVDTQTLAKSDGTREFRAFVEPRWAKRHDGRWDPVNTTVRVEGGRVVPDNTVVPMWFSPGGEGPFATLVKDGRELAFSWPRRLPAPVLDGDSATYAEVLPDVDLRVTAHPSGFSHLLVVKSRKAATHPALRRVRFGYAATGLTLSAAPGGGAEARDAHGTVAFSSPEPVMWDSRGAAGVPAGSPKTVAMAEEVGTGHLTVVPDQAMLADPATEYPVFVDPSWSAQPAFGVWKMVASRSDVRNSSTFTLNNGATSGTAGAGRTCDRTVVNGSCPSPGYYQIRSMFRMTLPSLAGKLIIQATFNITQKWSSTCNPASNARLWITGAISTSTSWNTQPEWLSTVADAPANRRVDSGAACAGAGNVAFNATAMVNAAQSGGWADLTVGLRAIDEGTMNQWKRFDHTTASLSIVYNSHPNTPDTLRTHSQACVTGSGRPVVGVSSPTLSARVTDPDGAGEGDISGTLAGRFELNSLSGFNWTSRPDVSGTPQANGTTTPSPAPSFGNGIHRWRVTAVNPWSLPGVGSGTLTSATTDWCEFEVDSVRPNTAALAPDVANSPFVAGKTIRLTLSPGGSPADTDVTGYNWWVVDGAGTSTTRWAPGQQVTIDWTPIAGQGTIHILAKDRIQNSVSAARYSFNAAQASTEVARWPLYDPAGSTTAVDRSGHGNDLTVALNAESAFGAPGRIVNGDTALTVDGQDDVDITTTVPQLDTSKSFTVAAWVKYREGASGAFLCQEMTWTCAVAFEKWGSFDEWAAYIATENSDGSSSGYGLWSTTPAVAGVWTHLALVYDAAADSATFYVNGRAEETATDMIPFNNVPGQFRIGRDGWGPSFEGSFADVRVWSRTVSATEVADIVDPTSPENVATHMVGQWLVEPESCFGQPATCADSSSYAHDVNLSGGVNLTTAGHTGSGLQFTAGDGVAKSTDPNTGNPGPVLHTDQSYTVSAWVKLTDADPSTPSPDLPNGNRTAVAQTGVKVSGFYLGYRLCGGLPKWSFSVPEADVDQGDDPTTGEAWLSVCGANTLTTANVGQWYHLVATYNAARGYMRLYINGILQGAATQSSKAFDTTGPTTIGAAWWTSTGGVPVQVDGWRAGTIDTVTLYQGEVPASSIGRIP